MKEAILVILAFLLGIGFEKFSRYANEDDCPRVWLGYNCRGNGCDHSDKAWDAAQSTEDQPRGNYRWRP